MHGDPEASVQRLSARVEALAAALRAAGADPDAAARLLGAAAAAVLDAVTLELMLVDARDEPMPATARPEPAPVPLAA